MERIEVLEMKCESAFYAITPKDRRRSLGVLMAMAVAVASHSARANDPLVDLTLNKPSAVGVIDGDDRSCGLGAPQNVVRARLIVRNTKREVGPYVVRLPGYATANDGVEKAGEGDLLDLYRPFYVAAKPGDTIRIDLVNHLNDSDPVSAGPAGAKITNLHTHGLIVRPRPYSPCGTLGDYIFDQVDENNTASYRIDIPKRIFGAYLNAPRDEGNHASGPYPAGPYWFHSHLHGAAKFDVLSGQAGFLSVDCPSGASPSACPNSAAHLNANEEKILALQDLQVLVDSDHTPDKMTSGGPITSASPETAYFTDISQYAPGACGNVATAPNGLCFAPATGFKIASTGPVPAGSPQAGGAKDAYAVWFFTVNGQVFPNIDLTARAPKHLWRIANMSAVVTYRLRLYDENGVWRKKAFKVVSVDGVLAGNSKPNSSPGDFELGRDEDELLLMPGARAEVVVSRQNEGVADKVWSLGTEGFTTGSGGDTWPKIILASVTMRGSPPTLEAGLAKPAQPPFFRVPVTITHSPLPPPANCIGLGDASYRRVRFWQPNAPFLIGPVLKKKGADDLTYVQAFRHEIPPGMQMHICARLGDVEIWALENDTDELHNFHIHQSKFRLASKQEMKRAGLSGSPVNDPTGLLDKSSPGLLAQYREEAESEGAVWHDSIPVPPRNGTELGSTVIVIPFKDPNQVGTFVYHCHILEHEDGGMMGVAEVYDPAAQRRAEVPATVREAGMGPPRSQFCGAAPANYSPIPLRASDAAIQVGWWDRIRRWSGGFL